MGNCLKTQLNAVVNNPALPVLGVIKFTLNSGTWFFAMSAKSDSNCIVSGESGVSFSSYGGSAYTNPFQLTSSLSGFNATAAANGNVFTISDKYNIKAVTDATYKTIGIRGVSQIEGGLSSIYLPDETDSIGIGNCTFKSSLDELLEWADGLTIKKIAIQSCADISGDLSDLSSLTSLENITISYCANITGDISDLNSAVIKNMALANSNIGGTIESFVAKQRTLGNATGSVSGNSAGWGKVTFNGSTANAKGTVSWTATTITMNGITITA